MDIRRFLEIYCHSQLYEPIYITGSEVCELLLTRYFWLIMIDNKVKMRFKPIKDI